MPEKSFRKSRNLPYCRISLTSPPSPHSLLSFITSCQVSIIVSFMIPRSIYHAASEGSTILSDTVHLFEAKSTVTPCIAATEAENKKSMLGILPVSRQQKMLVLFFFTRQFYNTPDLSYPSFPGPRQHRLIPLPY